MNSISTGATAEATTTATTALATFDHAGLKLRAITREGHPWFVAKDVCEALGYANVSKALADHVDPKDKHTVSLGLPGRAPWLINESGLYSLILRSNKPEAKAVQSWVTSTVLPTIRKENAYIPGADALSPEARTAYYAQVRGLLSEATRRHDRETEHDHWCKPHRRQERSLWAAGKIAGELGLPVAWVTAAAEGGMAVAMAQVAAAPAVSLAGAA